MSKIANINLFIISMLVFTFACGGEKSGKVTSISPDKKVTVTVSGTKPNFADPFKTSITIEAGGGKQAVETEIYAQELNEENVNISWSNSSEGEIAISQQDGSQRNFLLQYDNEGIELREKQ